MSFREIQLAITLSILSMASLASAAEESKTAQETLKTFLGAFAKADLKAMQGFYAPKVTVMKGSRLLDKRYGNLGGQDGTEKNKEVKREDLIAAYKKTIQNLGGKDDWIKRGAKLKSFDIQYITNTSPNADKIFSAVGAKEGDVLAVVNPKGDSLFFHLRKIEGNWLVIGEVWS